MNVQIYEHKGKFEYATLAETVASILTAAVRVQPALHLQHVQHRAKELDSLMRKLKKLGELETDSVEAKVKDLAGCRVVLYTNSDVSRFLQSGIVSENFDVDWDRTKIHHPVPETETADIPFISNNYVVKLKESRVKLPEYACLSGIWCEVQVQTTLNHAWSETVHDILYKRPALDGFGASAMKAIEERLNKIMEKYLLPAGYEFQKVENDFERLISGKELFDHGALKALVNCEDNNARTELLEKFTRYVLPNYDDIQGVYPEIRGALKKVIRQAVVTRPRPLETPFGLLPGRSSDKVIELAAEVFDDLRYINVEDTFDDICEMYVLSQTETSRHRWIKSGKELAEHNMDIWKEAGPIVQSRLVERIECLKDSEMLSVRPVLIAVMESVLNTEISGTSMPSYNSVTLHRGAVITSEVLVSTRNRAIGILEKLLHLSSNAAEQQIAVNTLMAGTRYAHTGDPDPQLITNILKNALRIVGIFEAAVPTLEFKILQYIEYRLWWLSRNSANLPTQLSRDMKVKTARGDLNDAILRFRDVINTDETFAIYKTLVGFESIFPSDWERTELDYERQQHYRNQKINELVESVSAENAEHWFRILEQCASTNSNAPNICLFLCKLGQTKPDISFSYVERLNEPLAPFLHAILKGINASSQGNKLPSVLNQWIYEKLHLSQLIQFICTAQPIDVELLAKALKAAIECSNSQAVLEAITATANCHPDIANELIDRILIPAIKFLTSQQNFLWIDRLSFQFSNNKLVHYLNNTQGDIILHEMLLRQNLSDHDERMLAAVAQRWPDKVIDFLGKRLKTENSKAPNQYQAIPYRLNELHSAFSPRVCELLVQMKRWFDADKTLFSLKGARLIPAIFIQPLDCLSAKLDEIITNGKRDDIEFVIEILRAYTGESLFQSLCKRIVTTLPEGDTLLTKVTAILDSTSVVSGEFGMVTAFRDKKKAISEWLEDASPLVKAFAKTYIHDIEQRIATEQRRADERLALSKLNHTPQR